MQLSGVVHVNPDGKTAKGRWYGFGANAFPLGEDKVNPGWMNGVYEVNYVKEKKLPNIFQFFKKPWTNGIPSYGRKIITKESKRLLKDAVQGRQGPYRQFIMDDYKEDKKQLFSILDKKDHDLIFWYTTLIDNFGHMDSGKPIKLMKHYLEMNEVAGKVKKSCPGAIIYILSDHGMERMEPKKNAWGMHSNHAFFSSSNGEKIEKPYQFYDLISKHKSE